MLISLLASGTLALILVVWIVGVIAMADAMNHLDEKDGNEDGMDN